MRILKIIVIILYAITAVLLIASLFISNSAIKLAAYIFLGLSSICMIVVAVTNKKTSRKH